MAVNPSTARSNLNTCYVACSGFGKSQALGNNPAIPKSKARVVLWDIDHDHKAQHFEQKTAYIRALRAALRSGKGFRLAWAGRCDQDTFEWWCRVVWSALDGNRETFIIVEELADVSPNSGKASRWWGQVNRRCRKYGGILHWTTQRSQEVSKTAFDQAAVKYIGYPNDGARVGHLAALAGVSADDLMKLEPLQFYRREGREVKQVQFKYRKPPL